MTKPSNLTKQFLSREIDPAFARRARIILENLQVKAGSRVLNVGCGRGFYEGALLQLFPQIKLTSVELNPDYIQQAKENLRGLKNFSQIEFVQTNAETLPFKSESFDSVICSEVLEHIDDDQKVMGEIYRVLKRNGQLLLSVPVKNYPFLWDPLNFTLEHTIGWHIPSKIWWLAGIWADHQRLYQKEDLLKKLKKSGFQIEKSWQATSFCFPFSHFLLYGIGKNLVESGVTKGSFNRFDFSAKPSSLTLAIKSLFAIFDNLNEKSSGQRFVNLVVKVIKF